MVIGYAPPRPSTRSKISQKHRIFEVTGKLKSPSPLLTFYPYQTDSPFEYDLIRFGYKTQNEKLKSTHAETEGASNRIEVFFLL